MKSLPTDRGYVEFRDSVQRPGEVEVRVYSDLVDGALAGLFAVHDSIPRKAIRMRGRSMLRNGRSQSASVCAVYWNEAEKVLEITPDVSPATGQKSLLDTTN